MFLILLLLMLMMMNQSIGGEIGSLCRYGYGRCEKNAARSFCFTYHFSFLGPLLEKRNLFNSLQETFYWLFYSCVVLDASFRVLLWMDLSRIDRGFRMAISL